MSSGANKGQHNPMIQTKNTGLMIASAAAVIGGGLLLAYKLSRTQKKAPSSQKVDVGNNKNSDKGSKAVSKFVNVENDTNLVKKCQITRLFVHPVKSCGGYEVRYADVLPRGLRYDREWVVIRRRDQKVMTIREIPAMRRITAIISEEGHEHEQGHPVMFLSYRSLDESKNTVTHPLFDENKQHRHPSIKIAEPTKVMFFVEIPITRNTLEHNISSSKPETSQFIDIFGLDGSVVEEAPQIAAKFFTEALNEDKKKKRSKEEEEKEETCVAKTDETMIEDEHYYLGRIARPRNPAQSKTYAKNVLDKALRIRAQDGSSLHILTEESMQWVCDQLYPTKEEEKGSKEISTATASSAPSSYPSLLTMPHLYRPNIVVKGVPFPEEDRWDAMSIIPSSEAEAEGRRGPIPLKTFHNCDRCAVITTSLDGQRHKEFQPTRLLRERHSIVDPKEGKPNKGMLGLNVNVRLANASSEGGAPNGEDDDETVLGVVSVGDTLIIESFNTPLNYV